MTQKYDEQMVQDWRQQLTGELLAQAYELKGESVPPHIQQRLNRLHARWGKEIVPYADSFASALADDDAAEEERKRRAADRKQQFETAVNFWNMLQAVGIVPGQ
jgi:hypothetical protein